MRSAEVRSEEEPPIQAPAQRGGYPHAPGDNLACAAVPCTVPCVAPVLFDTRVLLKRGRDPSAHRVADEDHVLQVELLFRQLPRGHSEPALSSVGQA